MAAGARVDGFGCGIWKWVSVHSEMRRLLGLGGRRPIRNGKASSTAPSARQR